MRLAEPALCTLIAPSRVVDFDNKTYKYNINQPNIYSKPLAQSAREKVISSWFTLADVEKTFTNPKTRYVTFNLRPLFVQKTVEVRMHSGTTEARKILLWISLWQQILWAASVDRTVPATADLAVLQPNGDIVKFAKEWLPNAKDPMQKDFLNRLEDRRQDIVQEWRNNVQLAGWVDYSKAW